MFSAPTNGVHMASTSKGSGDARGTSRVSPFNMDASGNAVLVRVKAAGSTKL